MVCMLSVDQLTHVEADAMALDASPADAVSVQQATHIMVLDYLGQVWLMHDTHVDATCQPWLNVARCSPTFRGIGHSRISWVHGG